MTHVLVVSSDPLVAGYGSATALRTFADAVRDHRPQWRVSVLAARGPGDPATRGQSTAWAVAGLSGGRMLRLTSFNVAAGRRAREFARSGPDVVVAWQPTAGWVARRVAVRAGVPFILRTCGPELHGAWSPNPMATFVLHPWTRHLLRAADAVVVKSFVERDLVAPVRRDGVHQIPNAVPSWARTPVAVAVNATGAAGGDGPIRRGSAPGAPLRLLAVCQLERQKNPRTLVEIARRFPPGAVEITVAGDGSQRRSMERLVRRTGAPVTLLGRVRPTALSALHAAHDALLQVSTFEGSSNAVLEALASGLPVCAVRTAVPDLVTDGVEGVLADSPAVSDIVAAARRLLDDGERQRMSVAARARASGHTPQTLLDGYSALFDEVLGRRAGGPPRLWRQL